MEDWEVQACLSVVQWRKHGEGRLAKALAFSVMAPSAWYWLCCSSLSRVVHHASETTKRGITFHMCADAAVPSSGE